MAQIRIMSWNIQVYGWTKFTRSTALPKLIAHTMALHKVDILVMLELVNGAADTILQAVRTELDACQYSQGHWSSQAVNVGDEAVGFVYRQQGGDDGFTAMTNARGQVLADPIWIDTDGDPLYFPMTGTSWTNAGGASQNGRRPAYMAFVTNAGTRFVVAGLHAPFAKDTLIQAYSAHLYGHARESQWISASSIGALFAELDDENGTTRAAMVHAVTGMLQAQNVPSWAIAGTIRNVMVSDLSRPALQGMLYQRSAALFEQLCRAQMTANFTPSAYGANNNREAAVLRALFTITTSVAAVLTFLWGLDDGMPMAIRNGYDSLPLATFQLNANWSNVENLRALFAEGLAVNSDARRTNIAPGDAATLDVVQAVFAGDFNMNHPDHTQYHGEALARLGGNGSNAYTALATGNGNTIRQIAFSDVPTTQTTSLNASYMYSWNQDNYDALAAKPALAWLYAALGTMRNRYYCDVETLINDLHNVARIKPSAVKQNENEIDKVFPFTTCVNHTDKMRANGYDNLACQGLQGSFGNPVAPDMLSLLGSWGDKTDYCTFTGASKLLNGVAEPFLRTYQPEFAYKNGTKIPPELIDVEDTGNFYKDFVSDHYPVCVTMTIT